jgi:hypothetical protein
MRPPFSPQILSFADSHRIGGNDELPPETRRRGERGPAAASFLQPFGHSADAGGRVKR